MKKIQIILPLAALAIVAAGFVFVQGSRNHRYFISAQTQQIGMDLIKETNSHRLFLVGPSLQDQLADLLASPTRVANVIIGDEPPAGDGSACSRLILVNDLGKSIGIRFRQIPKSERFQVLGHWVKAN